MSRALCSARGGVVALDEDANVVEVVRHLAAYNADESCGKCTPCREGTPRIVDALDRLIEGRGSEADLEELAQLAEVVELASLCGLGQAAGGPVKRRPALLRRGDVEASG